MTTCRSTTMREGRAFVPTARPPLLQRACACGRHASGGECEPCRLARAARARDATRGAAEIPASVRAMLRLPGAALGDATRATMRARLGHDFSRVRVHADGAAAASARDVGALAYTVGRHVVFGADQYRPATRAGRQLLAHELTHTIQQGQSEPSSGIRVGATDTPAEREAESVARRVADAAPLVRPHGERAGALLQRQPEAEEGDEPVVAEEGAETEAYDGDVPVNATGTTATEPEAEEDELVAALEPELAAEGAGGAVAERGGSKGGRKGGRKGKGRGDTSDEPAPPKAARWITQIDVDLSAQTLTLTWSDGTRDKEDKDWPISSGRGLPNTKGDPCKDQTEKNCTPVGSFTVESLGNGSTKNAHGDAMSWYVGFVDKRGIGIHDSQPVPGIPHSHGCVRVGDSPAADAFAKKINQHVHSGATKVNVTGKAPTKPWTKPVPKPKGAKGKKP